MPNWWVKDGVIPLTGGGRPHLADIGDAAMTRPGEIHGWGFRDLRGFSVLSAIAFVDGHARAAFLTFMPPSHGMTCWDHLIKLY